MSRSAWVRDLFFFEGDFDFRLGIGELIALEEIRIQRLRAVVPSMDVAQASVGALYERLGAGTALIEDVRQVLRLARIGAGADKEAAHDLVARHLVTGQLLECMKVAYAVLGVALVGSLDDKLGEPKGEAAAPPASPPGRKSTAKARPSAGPPARSTP